VKIARLTILLFFACQLALAEDGKPDDLQIVSRPEQASQPAPTLEQIESLGKRLSAVLPKDANWEESNEAKALAAQAATDLEMYFALMLPPGAPRAVKAGNALVRSRAAVVLGLSHDRRALQPLINNAVYDPEEAVRTAAAKALVQLHEPVALRKLVDLAIARDFHNYPWAVRKSACAAIKHYGDKDVVNRLLRELSYELAGGNPLDPQNKLRGVTQGIGTDNPLALPQASTQASSHYSEQDMYPVLSALKEVTGKSFGKSDKDLKTWQAWWKKEHEAFELK